MHRLSADHEVVDDAVVVRAEGDVDSNSVATLVDCLKAGLGLASAHRSRLLIVDLSAVTYFGSAGLNAVLECQAKGAADGTAVRLIASTPEVVRPIEVTNLVEVLRPYSTLADARAGRHSENPP